VTVVVANRAQARAQRAAGSPAARAHAPESGGLRRHRPPPQGKPRNQHTNPRPARDPGQRHPHCLSADPRTHARKLTEMESRQEQRQHLHKAGHEGHREPQPAEGRGRQEHQVDHARRRIAAERGTDRKAQLADGERPCDLGREQLQPRDRGQTTVHGSENGTLTPVLLTAAT
jgi:hypothetical protein